MNAWWPAAAASAGRSAPIRSTHKRRRLCSVLAAVAVGALGMPLATRLEANDPSTPQLSTTAKAKGCKDGPSDYVAGYFTPGDVLSGVFWCRSTLNEDDPHFLIVVIDRHAPRRLKCPDAMVSVNRPLGLRVLHAVQVPLSAFTAPAGSGKTRPTARFPTGPVIDTGDGGIGEQWICHEGAWHVRVYH